MSNEPELVWVLDLEGKLIQIPKPSNYDKTVSAISVSKQTSQLAPKKTRVKGGEHPHGTHLRYFSTPNCRCDLCREAATKYSREKRQGHRENPPQDINHGRVNSYSYFGCRCRLCKDAMLAHLAKYPPSEKSRQARNRRKNEKRKEQRLEAKKQGNN